MKVLVRLICFRTEDRVRFKAEQSYSTLLKLKVSSTKAVSVRDQVASLASRHVQNTVRAAFFFYGLCGNSFFVPEI